jgi:hypothetical protein
MLIGGGAGVAPAASALPGGGRGALGAVGAEGRVTGGVSEGAGGKAPIGAGGRYWYGVGCGGPVGGGVPSEEAGLPKLRFWF